MNRDRSRHKNTKGGQARPPKPDAKVKEVFGDIIVLSNENNYESRPIATFEEIDLPPQFFKLFKEYNFKEPTKIQSIAIPIALESYDIIGVAKTGSGKTLSFILPILMAIQDEKGYLKENGKEYNNEAKPRALVLAPTRELALQIYDSSLAFVKSMDQDMVCVYGGSKNSREQISDLAKGVDLVIATPGRLHDFMQRGKLDLSEVFIFVLDEADRMLDMGFLPQVKSITNFLKPDKERQTLLWSATWPAEVDALSRDLCKNRPITIQVGDQGLTINTAIKQEVIVMDEKEKKKNLFKILRANASDDFKVLIFCGTKKNCDFLAELLVKDGHQAMALHGDKDQSEREQIIEKFKRSANIMIATDVASRGLDIKNIKAVINYDFPNCIEDYIHRIGRTGRAGASGLSFSFFTDKNRGKASALCDVNRYLL